MIVHLSDCRLSRIRSPANKEKSFKQLHSTVRKTQETPQDVVMNCTAGKSTKVLTKCTQNC